MAAHFFTWLYFVVQKANVPNIHRYTSAMINIFIDRVPNRHDACGYFFFTNFVSKY